MYIIMTLVTLWILYLSIRAFSGGGIKTRGFRYTKYGRWHKW